MTLPTAPAELPVATSREQPPLMPYVGAIVVYVPPLAPPSRVRGPSHSVWAHTEDGYPTCTMVDDVIVIPATPEPPQPAVVYLVVGYREACMRTLGQSSECVGRVPFAAEPTPGHWAWPEGAGR